MSPIPDMLPRDVVYSHMGIIWVEKLPQKWGISLQQQVKSLLLRPYRDSSVIKIVMYIS